MIPFVAMCVLICVIATVQAALGQHTRTVELSVDIVAVFVVAWGSLRGFEEGALLGVIGGVMLDALGAAPIGLQTVTLGLLGGAASFADGRTVRTNVALVISTGVLLTVAYHLVMILGLQALGWHTLPAWRLPRILFPAAIVNTLALPVAYYVCERVYRSLTGWRQLEV